MPNQSTIDTIRQDCWDKALDCIAYSYIYTKKISKLSPYLTWVKALGIIIPLLVGAIAGTYYTDPDIMKWALVITSPLAIAQLVLSTLLTVTGYEDKVTKYLTKSTEYSLLQSEFELVAKYPNSDFSEYQRRYETLLERERNLGRDNQDVTEKYERMGMRYGLRNYRRSCAGCGIIPTSMTPTQCPVCGNF